MKKRSGVVPKGEEGEIVPTHLSASRRRGCRFLKSALQGRLSPRDIEPARLSKPCRWSDKSRFVRRYKPYNSMCSYISVWDRFEPAGCLLKHLHLSLEMLRPGILYSRWAAFQKSSLHGMPAWLSALIFPPCHHDFLKPSGDDTCMEAALKLRY